MGHFLIMAGALANCVCRPIRPDQLQPSGRKSSLLVGKPAAARTVSSVDRYEATRNAAIVGHHGGQAHELRGCESRRFHSFFGVSLTSVGHTSKSTNGTGGALLSLLRPIIRARGITMVMLKYQNHYEGASSWESTSADLEISCIQRTSPNRLPRSPPGVGCSLLFSCSLMPSAILRLYPLDRLASPERTEVTAHWRSF